MTASISYDMMDMMDSMHIVEIERLIEEGVISCAAEFDPEKDYRSETLDELFAYYCNYDLSCDDYEENIF